VDFHNNLTEIVRKASGIGATAVLLTTPTSHERGQEPDDLRAVIELSELVDVHRQYVDVVRAVAGEQDVLLCDLYDHFLSLPDRAAYFRDDGIHFTDPGGVEAAEFIFACLEDAGLVQPLLDAQQRRREQSQQRPR